MVNPRSLLDFEDVAAASPRRVVRIAQEIVTAIIPEPGDGMDMELIAEVAKIMYQNRELALFARSAIVRCAAVFPEVVAVWGKCLAGLLREKTIPEEMVQYVWRDYSMFEGEIQDQLQEEIWTYRIESVEASAAAFAYRSK
jgi:hypothetical protein